MIIKSGTPYATAIAPILRLYNDSLKRYSENKMHCLLGNALWKELIMYYIQSGDFAQFLESDKTMSPNEESYLLYQSELLRMLETTAYREPITRSK